DALYELEQSGPGQLFVEAVPQTSEWVAVQDRLLRASAS
ncbi:MAG TPA: threonylcarbamoyl-AMP synthase, partial [Gammaproteobacteria bacterium]|nr:threonylcarbamoyl-AMP synthase [Gammaproteobacteria bacterium]